MLVPMTVGELAAIDVSERIVVSGSVVAAPDQRGRAFHLEDGGHSVLVRVFATDRAMADDRVEPGEPATVYGRAFRFDTGTVVVAEAVRRC
jgi:hypothetical protein